MPFKSLLLDVVVFRTRRDMRERSTKAAKRIFHRPNEPSWLYHWGNSHILSSLFCFSARSDLFRKRLLTLFQTILRGTIYGQHLFIWILTLIRKAVYIKFDMIGTPFYRGKVDAEPNFLWLFWSVPSDTFRNRWKIAEMCDVCPRAFFVLSWNLFFPRERQIAFITNKRALQKIR